MKKASQKTLFALVFVAVFALTSAACLYGIAGDSIKKTFQVRSGGQLKLETVYGSVEVNTSNTNTLEIEVFREAKSFSSSRAEKILEDFEVAFHHEGNTVFVTGKYKGRGLGESRNNIGKYVRINFVVSAPREFNVDLATRGGKISVDDLKGEVRSHTSGGSLNFSRIQGPVWGRTSGGSIKLLSCTSTADVKTSGGRIMIGEVSGDVIAHTSGGGISIEKVEGSVQAKTSGGSVKAYIAKQPESDCSLKTSGGSVTVYLTDSIAVDVNVSTSGGRIYTEFPVTIQGEINERSLKAKINGGGPELYLHTSGGSIYIKKAD